MVAAIIVAAGSSQRVGFDKLTAHLAGKPVLVHTIAAFENASSIDEIILVAREDRVAEFRALIEAQRKPLRVIQGGARRQDSVRLGLKAAGNAEFVAVHDAARPLIRPETINHLVDLCRQTGAVSLASHVTDTLKRADADQRVLESIDRHNVFAMQTPQVFRRELLERAYGEVERRNLNVTDEVSAVELLGERVLLLGNTDPNPKITFASDLRILALLVGREASRAHDDATERKEES